MSLEAWYREREMVTASIGFCLPLSENSSRLAGITSFCGDVRLITVEVGLRIIVPPLEKVRLPAENAETMLEALSGQKIIPGESAAFIFFLKERIGLALPVSTGLAT